MRLLYPKEIKQYYLDILPYMVYMEDEGYRLSEDAPPEIVEKRKKIQDWNDKYA